MFSVWTHIKYLEFKNEVLQNEIIKLLQEKSNDPNLAIRERDA